MDQDGLFLMLKMCNGCSHNKVIDQNGRNGAGFERWALSGRQTGRFVPALTRKVGGELVVLALPLLLAARDGWSW